MLSGSETGSKHVEIRSLRLLNEFMNEDFYEDFGCNPKT